MNVGTIFEEAGLLKKHDRFKLVKKVGKKGVVREKSTHIEVIENCFEYARENNFSVEELEFSPVKGPEGNIEYLYHLVKNKKEERKIDIEAVVNTAHESL